jgi:hypothetical protein
LYAESTDKMRKNEAEIDWQREETEPYQELVQRIPNNLQEPQSKQKNNLVLISLLSSSLSPLLYLDSLYPGRNRERINPANGGHKNRQQLQRRWWATEFREIGGVGREEQEGNGWRKNCQEGEGDREEGGRW